MELQYSGVKVMHTDSNIFSKKIWYTRGVSRNANSTFPQDEYEQTPLVVDCSVSGCGFRQVHGFLFFNDLPSS